jgi:hypothetical protein
VPPYSREKCVGHVVGLKERLRGVGQELEPGVSSIPCKIAKMYNGQTGLSIKTSSNEHRHPIRLHKLRIQPWRNLALTWAITSCLINSNILVKKSLCRDRILIKANDRTAVLYEKGKGARAKQVVEPSYTDSEKR